MPLDIKFPAAPKPSEYRHFDLLQEISRTCTVDGYGGPTIVPQGTWDKINRVLLETCRPEAFISDPGTEKLLRTLLDRIYKMNLMAIPSLRVGEQDQDSNDPLVAWMSDARLMLYGSGQKPDVMRDLQGTPSPQREQEG